ncbi:MAG TPA: bifunctional riboflavin kinase/FAD synthetase [Actinomycetota bacterium]|nr:bifunctional riboflavin kinase/FAD synthetase [Actinomycetota bacterium]
MRSIVGIDAVSPPEGGSSVTIGTFDGVHLGHRSLIAQTIDIAHRLGTTSVAVTWDRHPAEILRPDKMPPLLSSATRKTELMGQTGIDVIAVLAFDEDFSHMPPERFVERVLVEGLACRSVLVGHDWRFGHRAKGDVPLLRKLGDEHGFEVVGAELLTVAGEPVSSSRIRKTVAAGDMATARVLLGRPFEVEGVVVRGAARGKGLGYPTANLQVDPAIVRPPRGVYAGVAEVAGLRKPAAISIGVNPTFGGEPGVSPVSVEAFLLDFDQEIYDDFVRLEFWKRLRDELKFASVDDLVAQMAKDVAATRETVAA